jgi:hypothetical protein
LARIFGGNQKNTFYHHLLRWRLCYFSYSVDMLVFHACSNKKSSHTQQLIVHIKIVFIWKFISSRHHTSKSRKTTIVSTHQSIVKDKHLYSYMDY